MDVESGCTKDNAQESRRLETINILWQLYKAATEDDGNRLMDLLNRISTEKRISKPSILCLVRPQGNTMLHTAVEHGKITNVTLLLECYPSLLWMRNWKGDTALHVAARCGQKEIAEVLIDFTFGITGREDVGKYSRGYLLERLSNEAEISWELLLKILESQEIKSSFETLLLEEEIGKEDISIEEASAMPYEPVSKKSYPESAEFNSDQMKTLKDLVTCLQNESKQPLVMLQNYNGDTPLHESLAMLQNNKVDTELHKALRISYHESVVPVLIGLSVEVWFLFNREKKSPLYLAVEARCEDAIEVMLRDPIEIENLTKWRKGLSPLRAAILAKNEDLLIRLLRKEPRLIHLKHEEEEPDSRVGVGSALHLAAFCGCLKVVNVLLKFNPFAATEKSSDGSFPVHVASRMGHVDVIKRLLPYCRELAAMTDNQGRNILHVAAECGKYDVVRYLLKHGQLQMLVNQMDKKGSTPLHLACKNYHVRTLDTLARHNATDLNAINKEGLTALDTIVHSRDIPFSMKVIIREVQVYRGASKVPTYFHLFKLHFDALKAGFKTLSLVATLVATVTFAAGFTMPGGYNNSGPDEGMATMTKNSRLQAFVLCNTIAMYSSTVVAITFIWAHLGDIFLASLAMPLGVPFLAASLTTMSLGFMTGISMVVGKLSWLANAVLIIGLVFHVLLALLFLPFFLPVSRGKRHIFSPIYYYLSWLLLQVTDDFDDLAAPPDK